MKRFLICVALLLATITLQAGELVFHWNKMAESKIYDMEFMPDNDYFVIVTANEFQVRRTEDGEIVKTYPKNLSYKEHDIDFSNDSTKLILSYGNKIEVRNVKDFSIIKEYTLTADTNGLSYEFDEIAIDTKRPYLYAAITKTVEIPPYGWVSNRRIMIYNYETMEEIGELIPSKTDTYTKKYIAISSDGKYLSVINQGTSYITTFDLTTQKEIQSFKVCDGYDDGSSGIPVSIKFSELNSDKIYFTGEFPQDINENNILFGLLVYSIAENKIIDSTFGVGGNKIYNSKFTFFNNESKAMASNGIYLYIVNYLSNNIDFKIMLNENIPIYDKILYSKVNDYFVSYCEYLLTKVGYKDGSNINEKINVIDTVYPNPTTNQVFIKYNCEQPYIYYKILNINSQVLTEKKEVIQNNLLSIDFSTYSTGYYIIQIECGGTFRNYMVIKEN